MTSDLTNLRVSARSKAGRVRLVLLTALSGLILALPASAVAATTVGQAFVPTAGGTCNGLPDWELVQTARASGPSYAAPSNGVLTAWSFQASPNPTATVLTLRAFHPTGTLNQFKVIADGGALQTIPGSSGLHTFPTRIPVQTGDSIGVRSTSGTCATGTANPGDTYDYRSGTATGIGAIGTFSSDFGYVLDISAVLEPDADHDGFGDESQDQCPANGSTQGPCAAVKKKCKHKKHKSAAVAKKCKKEHHR